MQSAGRKRWSFRLDRDDIAINISTMRVNLLALFVEPHNANAFLLQRNATESSTAPPSSDKAKGLRRLRELIVDLKPPVFRSRGEESDSSASEDIFLFAPPTMSRGAFKQALSMLDNYHHNGNSNLATSDGQSVTCVSKGPGGQLCVFGGLVVYPGCSPMRLLREFQQLNDGQREAIRKILVAEDYALLLGLPGTGKTSTISLAIRILLAKGQKVLLTSFTHSAVDNLLLKLVEAGLTPHQVVRLGAANYVHSSSVEFVLDTKKLSSVEALALKVAGTRLVACTVLTASRHVLLKHFALDCCVVDEAGQITQPAALGAILGVKRFVLVGDDYQLPPLVVSQEAQAKGMDVSLFKRLLEAHPQAVSCLTAQYRMNEGIMEVCNALIYEHRMLCASEAVAKARLRCTPNIPSPCGFAATSRDDWLFQCLSPHNSVLLLNTDGISADKSGVLPFAALQSALMRGNVDQRASVSSVTNAVEAALIRTIVWGMRRSGVSAKDIGIISPFRAQVELIKSTLAELRAGGSNSISADAADDEGYDVSTVDKFQGRDMDVIVLSTVKGAQEGRDGIGNLLRDWRRINVAVTR